MNLLGLLIISISVLKCLSIKTRPVPIHGAKEIEKILSRHLQFDGSLFNFIKGTQRGSGIEGSNYADENLDVNVLDIKNFRKILNLAKQKYKQNYRRQNFKKPLPTRAYLTGGFKTHERAEPYSRNVTMFIIIRDKIFDLMLQSIYATKERIQDTKRIRQHFRYDRTYAIAILYQTCSHHINKMETLFAQLRYFHAKTYFLWYLIIYEKILQSSIDIEYAVGRIYEYDKKKDTRQISTTPEIPEGLMGPLGPQGPQGLAKGGSQSSDPENTENKKNKFESKEAKADASNALLKNYLAKTPGTPRGPSTKKLNAAEMAGGRLDYKWTLKPE